MEQQKKGSVPDIIFHQTGRTLIVLSGLVEKCSNGKYLLKKAVEVAQATGSKIWRLSVCASRESSVCVSETTVRQSPLRKKKIQFFIVFPLFVETCLPFECHFWLIFGMCVPARCN